MVALDLIIAESIGVGVKSKAVGTIYGKLIAELGSEMSLLMDASTDEIARVAWDKVVEGVGRVLSGRIEIVPGFDGQYGTVKIWGE